jgi:hypothetical protein
LLLIADRIGFERWFFCYSYIVRQRPAVTSFLGASVPRPAAHRVRGILYYDMLLSLFDRAYQDGLFFK